jgi:AcrR family transcriptional regulator
MAGDPSRKRNLAQTKARILSAAKEVFSQKGYAHSGIREIADAAQANSSLIGRYFGSKANLFEAALSDAVTLQDFLTVDRHKFGELAAANLSQGDLDLSGALMGALASGDPIAQKIASDVTERNAIAPLAAWLGPPNERQRAVAITSLCMGFLFCTRQFPLSVPLPVPDAEGLSRWLSASIQELVDQK